MNAVDIARTFVDREFPNCKAAILAGSAARGEETEQSDLDILVINEEGASAYEESLSALGRSIDVLFYTHKTCLKLFKQEIQRRRPVLSHMCAQGIILKDTDGLAQQIQHEARQVLQYGPEPISQEEQNIHRNELTDYLDDLIGSKNPYENYIIAFHVIVGSIVIQLNAHKHWLGAGKWLLREFQHYDPQQAQQCLHAMDSFYKHGRKEDLIAFAEQSLQSTGGRLHTIVHGQKEQPQQEDLLTSEA
ncbi:nucleotidyltransferase domain-containing protein [Dictyobacter kobayashii]|uniref:Polymerase nucleotidyl transferase domain-containing protein n=1 Tax=Dictyobacter kobayashii TaxID=2014872 RepID=A0A402ACV1_9CHLR|nr:nucleotidyltransferase domain-containing protein [Dictyobacter kobayashii]GCE16930.1 hypothetical protein KDK_07300 [Dictyobacter kobayashii]